jgi:hypothetical protein
MNNHKIKVCFSGPRLLTDEQVKIVKNVVIKYHNYFEKNNYNLVYNVGDASGVDITVFNTLSRIYNNDFIKKFIVKDKSKKQEYAQRSMRMVSDTTVADDSYLIAFPNKHCPAMVTPSSHFCGSGSGTWATIAFAKNRKLKIILFPIEQITLPNWIKNNK